MKKLLLTLTLLLGLGLSLPGVAAQTPVAESTPVMGEQMDIEGVESVYDRTFMDTSVNRMVSIQGVTFDSSDNAEKYLDEMKSQIDEAKASSDAMSEMEVDELEAIDLDGFVVTTFMEDIDLGTTAIFFVDDNQVFLIVAIDVDVESSTALSTDVATYVADAESKTDDVTFSEDGTSTGGVFDRMPAAGDDLVSDLPTVTDMVLLEAGE